MKFFGLIFLILKVNQVLSGHDLHTSFVQMRELFHHEKQAIEGLRKVLEMSRKLQDSLSEYISDYEKLKLHLQENADFLNNPVNDFLLLRHVGLGWNKVMEVLQLENQTRQTIDTLLERNQTQLIPDESDVDGASFALARLHGAYRFNLTALTRDGAVVATLGQGEIRSQALAALSDWELTKIGIEASNKRRFDVGVDFLQAALDKSLSKPDQWRYFGNTIEKSKITSFLKTAIKIHDHTLETKGYIGLDHTTHMKPLSTSTAKKKKHSKIKELELYLKKDFDKGIPSPNNPDVVEDYQAGKLCRGEQLRTEADMKDLYCRYVHNDSPWLRIGPMKAEIQNLEPYVVVLHDMLSAAECDNITSFMGTRLVTPHRSGKKLKKWSMKHGWPKETDNPVLDRLTRRVEAVAGVLAISEVHAEKYMVGNYGMGGTYQVHSDYHGPNKQGMAETGDRIATLMSYLEAPEAGGATVFPWLGVTVWPKKGSTVLWWNMLPSGGHDQFTRHMACPVLIGTKWIGNKWVGYDAQWRHKRCEKDSLARFKVPLH